MRKLSASLLAFAMACVPPPPDRSRPSTDPNEQPDPAEMLEPPPEQETPPVTTPAGLTAIVVDPAKISVQVGNELVLVAWARYDDGSEVDATGQVSWTSEATAVLAPTAQVGRFTALSAGTAIVRAKLGAFEATSTVDVVAGRVPAALSLSVAELTLAPGASGMVSATLAWSDGVTEDVTSSATWISSDPAVSVTAGRITRSGAGVATVQASHSGFRASLQVLEPPEMPEGPCTYPTGTTAIRLGSTMPNVSWQGAYRADGTTFDFSLEDVHCGAEFQDKTVIIFVIGAGWCGACTQYTQGLNPDAPGIEAAGGLIVYVEAETASYAPADNAYANRHIGNIIGNGPGIRVGDADTTPRSGAFLDSPMTTQFPTAFVVRKSDMKIIINQNQWNNVLPYTQIALHPDADWSNPNNPPSEPNCGPSDEEPTEPNDSAAQAPVITAGSFSAGICNGEPDFYRVSHTGSWTLDLEFTHAIGDIDVFVWNEATDSALTSGGQEVGSESGDDDESFTHSGPALVKVFGYRGATAPYTLRLTTN